MRISAIDASQVREGDVLIFGSLRFHVHTIDGNTATDVVLQKTIPLEGIVERLNED